MTASKPLYCAAAAMLLAGSLLGLAVHGALATSGPGCFRIIGVAANDVLNLRIQPSSSAPLSGNMHPKRHGIIALSGTCQPASGPKSKQWCKITHYVDTGTTVGWASRRFLQDVDCP